MNVRIVKHEEIDKVKWNSCIHYATSGNVLGYKWYLDNVAKRWDALVDGDYETVLPLINKQTLLKANMLFQPRLLTGLGIYSVSILSASRIKNILEAIPDTYQKVDLLLNEGVKPPENLGFTISKEQNYQLLLNTSYETLEEKYTPDVANALNLAREHQLILSGNLKPERVAEFYQQFSTDKKDKEANFHAYQRIMYNALHRGWGFASAVENQNGDIVSAAFFIYSHGRLMRLLSHSSPEGKAKGAETLLFDMLIRGNAQRPLILDFHTMGSQRSFEQFGAQANDVYRIQRNKKKWGLF